MQGILSVVGVFFDIFSSPLNTYVCKLILCFVPFPPILCGLLYNNYLKLWAPTFPTERNKECDAVMMMRWEERRTDSGFPRSIQGEFYIYDERGMLILKVLSGLVRLFFALFRSYFFKLLFIEVNGASTESFICLPR